MIGRWRRTTPAPELAEAGYYYDGGADYPASGRYSYYPTFSYPDGGSRLTLY